MNRLAESFSILFLFILSSSAQAVTVTVCASGCDLTNIPSSGQDNGPDILVSPGTYKVSDLRITGGSLKATSQDPTLTIIDARNLDGSVSSNFVISNAANTTIRGFTIKGGRAGIFTGNKVANDKVILENLIIEGNDDLGAGSGGGITGSATDLTITNSIIQNNVASGFSAAGVSFLGETLAINGNSKILNNTGVGISIDTDATAVIEDTTISGNTAVNGGGMVTFANTTLTNVTITGNTASNQGGGIYKDSISTADAALNIYSSTISGNTATRGGGIYLKGTRATLNSFATVTGNTATEGIAGSSGGGLYCTSPNNAAVAANSITGNTPGNISSNCGTIGVPSPPIIIVSLATLFSSVNYPAAPTDRDPINTYSGELFSQKPRELNLGGPMPLYFQRYYAAYLRRNNILGDLGSNWRHNFDARLFQSGNTISYVSHDGRSTEFLLNLGSGEWQQQNNTDTPYQLSVVGGQDTVLYDPEVDRIYTFDFTTSNLIIGRLVKIEDGKGNAHTLTYNNPTNAQLVSVSDGLGRTLNRTYNNDEMPKISVVDDGTRSISFQYTDAIDTEYLTLATDARSGITSFGYEDTSTVADHALMLSMMRPQGNTPYTQTYYDTSTPLNSGGVATQTDASGNTYSFAYDGGVTTLTDPLTNTRVQTSTTTGELSNSQDTAGQSIVIGSDSTGRRNSITDRFGDVTTMNYDAASGHLSSITNADQTSASAAYAAIAFGNISQYDLTSISHTDGTTESFSYDASGNLTLHTDRLGNPSSATYNSRGQALTVTNRIGGTSTNTYNGDATLNTTQDPAGNTTTMGYDALKRVNLVTFADSNTRGTTYDNADNILSSTDENSNTTTLSYDANGNLASAQNPLLNTTTYAYDGNDRLLSVTNPLAGIVSRTFDQLGRVATTTDENSNVTTLGYDIHNRLNSVTDPIFNIWTSAYDLEGIIASTTDPLSNTTSFTSDNMGRITQVNSPLGNINRVSYDTMGRVATLTDALDNVTTLTRDARGLLSAVSLPGGTISASYTRNALGQFTVLTDPNGNDWNRDYDNMGRQISSTDPLANMQSISYDNRNRPASITLPGSLGSLTLGYDPAGNLTSTSFSDTTSFSYTYDANNRLMTADGITLGYDANNRITDSNGIAIIRDAGGRIASMTLATGKAVTYTYDANDRVTDINDWAGGVTTFSYDNAGRLTGVTRPNGINATRTYDNDSRLSDLSEGSISTISLTRDAKGQITDAIRNVPVTASSANLTNNSNTVDAASQLSGASYDAMGRLTSDGSNSYVWNLASQLTSFTTASGSTTATYDATGNRLSKTSVSSATHAYTWNYALGLPSISIEQESSSDLRYYIHTPAGALLYSIDATTDARNFYHYDEMGNTLFVSNDAGNVVASYAYSPFGQLMAETGTLDNPFTWQGQFGIMSEGDGLYYIRARYYDANAGRFISRDLLNSSVPKAINPYQYAYSNPLLLVDVDGLNPVDPDQIFLNDLSNNRARMGDMVGMSSLAQSPWNYIHRSDPIWWPVTRSMKKNKYGFKMTASRLEYSYARLSQAFLDDRRLFIDEYVPYKDRDINSDEFVEDINRDTNLAGDRSLGADFNNDRLVAVGFPGAFAKPEPYQYDFDPNVPWSPWTNYESSQSNALTPNDYGVARGLTAIFENSLQLSQYLYLALSSNREAVINPTNPDKIKSVVPELQGCIVLC